MEMKLELYMICKLYFVFINSWYIELKGKIRY